MWSNLAQYIGHDVMSLMSVPVWIMEPFTVLQKMSEIMEYTDLLDRADLATTAAERHCEASLPMSHEPSVDLHVWRPLP